LERKKKHKIVEELGAKLKRMDSMFVAEYSGMSVAQMTRLRRELRGVDTEFTVVKNTLFKIACEGTRAAVLKDKFQGPNAIFGVYRDPIATAKILAGLARDIPQLKLKAGFLGDQVLTVEEITRLATIPPKEVLVARFMGLLQGMPQRLVYVLSGNMSKLLITLNAIKTQKEQA
jgi:large subunit ribosomal protein L10